MMCGNEQAAPWCLVLTGNTTAATKSEAATLQLPDVAAEVFPTIHPSLLEEAARLPHNTFFPPFLDPAIFSLACHPSTVQWAVSVGLTGGVAAIQPRLIQGPSIQQLGLGARPRYKLVNSFIFHLI